MGNKVDVDEIRGAQQALARRRANIELEIKVLHDEASHVDAQIEEYEIALRVVALR